MPPEGEVFGIAGVEAGGFEPAGLADGVIAAVFVLVVVPFFAEQAAHMDIQAGQLPDRVRRISLGVNEMLVAVDENAELRAPVAQVVIGDDGMPQEAQQAGQSVSQDGAAEMADVQRLGDIGAAVVDDVTAGRADRCDAQPLIRSHRCQGFGQETIAVAQIDEARSGDFRGFPSLRGGQVPEQFLGDLTGGPAQALGQRESGVDLVIPMFRPAGSTNRAQQLLDHRGFRNQRGERRPDPFSDALQKIHVGFGSKKRSCCSGPRHPNLPFPWPSSLALAEQAEDAAEPVSSRACQPCRSDRTLAAQGGSRTEPCPRGQRPRPACAALACLSYSLRNSSYTWATWAAAASPSCAYTP